MRAPILSGYGQTNPSKQGLSYLSDAGATPEAFGAGVGRALGGLGESIVEASEEYEKRNAKTERFGALIGLSEFQTQTATQLTELKRSAAPDVKDFPNQANTLYTQAEQKYLATLPPRLQTEFTYRARQIKQGVMTDALQFQYTQQDAFFVEGVNKEYERAKNAVFSAPDDYAKWNAHLAETIAATDLPTVEKARLAREMDAGLTAVLYGKEAETLTRENAVRPSANFMRGQFGAPGENLTQISTRGGRPVQVHKMAAASFEGLIKDLEDRGYEIESIGGFNDRNIAGTNKKSQHAYGNAIDINPSRNPDHSSQTDLPPDISQLAAKHGLIWGGDWKDPDPMHFEWAGGAQGAKSSLLAAVEQVESGGRAGAVSSAGAIGLMQVMPATAKEIAQELGDQNFPTTGDSDIAKYLSDPTVSRRYGAHYLNKMLDRYGGDQKAALIAYNGGPARADAWIAAGRNDAVLPRETAAYADKVMTAMQGQSTFSELDSDPRFADVPLEDRLAIQAGAQRKVDEEVAAAVKAAQAATEAQLNSLFVGLHDGTMNETALQAYRNANPGMDIDDIEKAEKILADRTKALEGQQFINGAIAAGGSGYGTQDNDQFNDWFKANKGADAIGARDMDSFNSSVLPAVQTLQDIPTDLVGLLTTMSRSNDTDAMRWAYDRFLDLQDKAPSAFDARVTEDMAKQIDQYRYMRGWAKPEQLNEYIAGGRNPQEVSVNNAMDEQARKILADPKTTAGKMVAGVTALWDDWFEIDWTTVSPQVEIELQRELSSGFVYNYRVTGDEAKALELTKVQTRRRWGETTIGGRGEILMKYPLDKAGYPPLAPQIGDVPLYDNWEDVIRTEYGMIEDETFEIVGDLQTTQELEAFRRGETRELPSYVIYKWTEDGRRIPMDDRWFGAP